MTRGLALALRTAAGFTAILQLFIVARGYVVPVLAETWTIRELPAWQRAAWFEQGEAFAGYIAFLRAHIPEEGRVILPPSGLHTPEAHVGFMQGHPQLWFRRG